MSWQATTWAMKQGKRVDSHALLILIFIGNYAGHDGSTYVGQRRLAEETNLSERTVRRILDDLEHDGFIKREERKRGSGARSTDIIQLLMPPDEEPANSAGSPSEEPANLSGGAGNGVRGEPANSAGGTNQRLLTSNLNQDSPNGESTLPGFEEKKPARAGRKTKWPDGWSPDLKVATEKFGHSLPRAKEIAEKFHDRSLATGAQYIDWPAAWRMWLANERDFAARSRPVEKPPSKDGFSIMKS